VWPPSAARHADRLGWITAFAIHAASMLVVAVTAGWAGRTIESGDPFKAAAEMFIDLDDIPAEILAANIPAVIAAFLGTVLFVEACVAGSALLLTPVASRDEPFTHAFSRTFRRLLATSPWLITAGLAAVAAALAAHGIAAALDMHESNAVPFAAFAALGTAITLAWIVPLLIVAVGRTDHASCRWPPPCQGCGYRLVDLATQRPCPECGLALSETVGEHVRPGITGSIRAATFHAVTTPWTFGQTLRVGQLDQRLLRGLFAWAELTALFTAFAAIVLFAVVQLATNSWSGIDDEDLVMSIAFSLFVGSYVAAGGVAFALTAATLAGGFASFQARRNLLPAAAQAACWAAPALLVAPVGMWLSWVVAIIVGNTINTDPGFAVGAALVSLLVGWNILVPLATGVYFLVAVYIATRHARHAHR
ncbi:MAG: hypothetical protein AAF078_06140, partial [Planctomycetota bacterium]